MGPVLVALAEMDTGNYAEGGEIEMRVFSRATAPFFHQTLPLEVHRN